MSESTPETSNESVNESTAKSANVPTNKSVNQPVNQSAGSASEQLVNAAVAQGGAYEVIRKRLDSQGNDLQNLAQALNQARLSQFGGSEMEMRDRIRVRTDNNCTARDMVQVGEYMLFGYNVFLGLKPDTEVADVFALIRLTQSDDGSHQIEECGLSGTFLDDPRFRSDFAELYRYYKHTRLIELRVKDGKLLAGFQIGERAEDIRVFRWLVNADASEVRYQDNRGERDIALPEPYDFSWETLGREAISEGLNAHIAVANTLFIRCENANLTLHREDNTKSGKLLLHETLQERTQSLNDIEVSFAQVDSLLLVRILPYREAVRYYLYNPLNDELIREDLIGASCVQLPEDHGVIYPGGYYLQTGERKTFDARPKMRFKRKIRSPNGEDVLYVFYNPDLGNFGLYGYNLITKDLQNPLYGNGYALAENGRLVIFTAEAEPTRVHPMQIWQTPYFSDEFASRQPVDNAPLARIGNPDLVRGVSDLFSIARLIDQQSPSMAVYERLRQQIGKLYDDHYWLDDAVFSSEAAIAPIAPVLTAMKETIERVVDEFEKVDAIRQQSQQALNSAKTAQQALKGELHSDSWQRAPQFAEALGKIRARQGKLAGLAEMRYIDTAALAELEKELITWADDLGRQTVQFLASDDALTPYEKDLTTFEKRIEAANGTLAIDEINEDITSTAAGLDELSNLMNSLEIADPTLRTRIVDGLSGIYARLNQLRAQARHKAQSLGSEEAAAQFAAQFNLLTQSTGNALNDADSPQACDEGLARLLVQLEGLESQFGDYDEFLVSIVDKREEIQSAFDARKQQLMDARQRKAQHLNDAADRLLKNIDKRVEQFSDTDALNTYLATDALVLKLRSLADDLRELDEAVRADDIDARFKALKEQAIRGLRDKSDLFSDGGKTIQLGPRHRFSVNTQALDLTLLPRNDQLCLHLTGTQYFSPVQDEEMESLRAFWDMGLISESGELYRSEYLAAAVIRAAERSEDGLTRDALQTGLADIEALTALVAKFAAGRYQEGYEKGIHDHDAAQLILQVLPLLESAGNLRFSPAARGLAMLFWGQKTGIQNKEWQNEWPGRARSALAMQQEFASAEASDRLIAEMSEAISEFVEAQQLAHSTAVINAAADYLLHTLGEKQPAFLRSRYARELNAALKRLLSEQQWQDLQATLTSLGNAPGKRYRLALQWLQTLINRDVKAGNAHYVPEAAALLADNGKTDAKDSEVDLDYKVENLMGEHPLIDNRSLVGSVDDFLERNAHHRAEVVPAFQQFQRARQALIARERDALELERLLPHPLTSFVRNKLINNHYLPLIGDNFAKQMGTVGESKRSDLMGLLMMISPPGYGKTTLMEYVANRLGLIFMKINCPSLGHEVTSLDPERAPNATARQELERLNLAFEMGNNVMLYLDDIQHTHPEFLQKFISLCDGTRRIDGVWRGKAKTYDLRGRKFAVVMAGNPYTESGEVFNVPDMLANRADIYNLGDIIGDSKEAFALSYLENALTSNAVLAPLALRPMDDVYRLVALAQGKSVETSELSHPYSGAEIDEIVGVLQKMQRIRDVVLTVNHAYIDSAAQEDRYRTEPPFRLQGSYRNMNKMSEKVSAVLNDEELAQLIDDHYQGEAQLLKDGSEANLLKLAELRDQLSDEESQRWQAIKETFQRLQSLGGSDSVAEKIVLQLRDVRGALDQLGQLDPQITVNLPPTEILPTDALTTLSTRLETALKPLFEQLNSNLDVHHAALYNIYQLSEQMGKSLGDKDSLLAKDKSEDKKTK